MNEQVAAYLEEQKQKTQAARARKLVELGLWEKEFDPEDKGYSSAYPFLEDGKYYRKAPVEVTEEEWAEICRYAGGEKPVSESSRNPVCKALRVIANIFYIGGFLIGVASWLITGAQGYHAMGLIQGATVWISAGVTGTVILGLSEIIRLLDR